MTFLLNIDYNYFTGESVAEEKNLNLAKISDYMKYGNNEQTQNYKTLKIPFTIHIAVTEIKFGRSIKTNPSQ